MLSDFHHQEIASKRKYIEQQFLDQQKKAEQRNQLRLNPHLQLASPERTRGQKKKKKRKKPTGRGSPSSMDLMTRRMGSHSSLSRMASPHQHETSSFVFTRRDELKDALTQPKQNFFKRMTNSHRIREFETRGTGVGTESMREAMSFKDFVNFYSSSDSSYEETRDEMDSDAEGELEEYSHRL